MASEATPSNASRVLLPEKMNCLMLMGGSECPALPPAGKVAVSLAAGPCTPGWREIKFR